MKIVKKIISLLLSVLFMFGSTAVICFALDENTETGAEAEAEAVSTEDFFLSLSDMIIEYDLNSLGSSVVGGNSATNRIVVKTVTDKELTDTQGAKAVLEGWNSVHILQYSTTDEANAALEFYKAQDYVLYAEMDVYYTYSSGTQVGESIEYTETDDNTSWGTSAVNLDFLNEQITASGKLSDDDEVVVAVFDSGLLKEHALFKDKTRLLDGYNVFEENTDTSEGDTGIKSIGHGTHVAGIVYENTLPNVKIRPYRVNIDHGQDSYSTAMTLLGTAIYTAVELGDDVINVSMRWGAYGNEYLTEAIEFAYDNNVPLIAAADNYSIDASYTYPANLENVITVSAVDENFIPADFSNYGSCVDLAAPGVDIASACNNIYIILDASGTSMAAPFVSAAAATIKLIYPDISSLVLTDLLKSSVTVPTDWDTDYGVGVLNCKNLMSVGKTSTPKISFNEDGEVQISTASTNAVIYYTTDKTSPVIGKSSVYSSPISTNGVSTIKAIAYEVGKLPSDLITYALKWSVSENMYYKETTTFDDLRIPPDAKIISCYSSDKDVVTVNKAEKKIYATGAGEAKVYIYLENNRKVTVNVEVDYNFFQWFLIIVCWGYFWYI